MILPGETEAGSAGMQPCRGIAWWAHRDDDRERGSSSLALFQNYIGSKDPHALKIPARRAECSLTGNAHSPVHAEPRQDRSREGRYTRGRSQKTRATLLASIAYVPALDSDPMWPAEMAGRAKRRSVRLIRCSQQRRFTPVHQDCSGLRISSTSAHPCGCN